MTDPQIQRGIDAERAARGRYRDAMGQRYRRWFTEWPSTHENAGQTVEVMPVADLKGRGMTIIAKLTPEQTAKMLRGEAEVSDDIVDPERRALFAEERENVQGAFYVAITLGTDPDTTEGLVALADLLVRALKHSERSRAELRALVQAVEANEADPTIQALSAAVVSLANFAYGDLSRIEADRFGRAFREHYGIQEIRHYDAGQIEEPERPALPGSTNSSAQKNE